MKTINIYKPYLFNYNYEDDKAKEIFEFAKECIESSEVLYFSLKFSRTKRNRYITLQFPKS